MAETNLTPEELGSTIPPSDSRKYEIWLQHQVEAGLRDAADPKTTWTAHDEVFRELEERRKNWRSRAEKQRNVA
jgi:hypothetical protein